MRADFLIVGAGIAGLSLASELSRVGRVIVAERADQPGYHATARSAAIFSDGYGSRGVQALSRRSRTLLRSSSFDSDVPLLKRRGLLLIATADSINGYLSPVLGTKQKTVSASYARAMVPALDRSEITRAIYDAEAADIDVHELQSQYLSTIRRNGGIIITGYEIREGVRLDGIWSVNPGSRPLTAEFLINASGAWADDVAVRLGARALGLTPLRRSAAIIETGFDVRDWPMVVDADETLYFKPVGGRLMISPADETKSAACDAYAEDLDIAIAVDRFERLTSSTVRRVTTSWAGLRTFAPDRNPVLGFDPRVSGLFWLAGQGGFGVQTAPAMAELAAAMITKDGSLTQHQELIAMLSPARLAS